MAKRADIVGWWRSLGGASDAAVVKIDAACRPHVARPKLLALRWLDAAVLVLVAVVAVFVVDAGTDLFAWLGRVLDVAAGRSASAVYCVGAAASVVAGAVLVLPLVRGDRRKAVPELTLPAAVRVAASVLLARPTVLAAIGAGLLAAFDGAHAVCDLGRAGVWPWAATAGAASMPASLAAVLVLMGVGSGGLLLAVGLHGSWRVRVRDAKRRQAHAERERRAAEHAKDVLADRGDSPFVDFKDLREWFESDDPIRHPDEDRFEHRFVAHAVARKIDGFSADRFKPASMQILGPRGSGKSSLMAMVEYYLNHPHARPTREAAGGGALATSGTESTGAGENSVARSEPAAARARPATYIVTSVSLWEFTSAEAAMRAILRALVDAIGERAPTADLLGVPSRYAAVVAAPGGLWALAGAVLAGAIEPEDLIARIGRRAVAAGVNVLLWIDDLERFETSETDTLTKLGALLTLMRRTEGLSFVIARSPNAVPAAGADGAAAAGFDFEKVVDGTEWVRVEHAPMDAVLMQFRAECERVRRVVEGVPLRDLSARRLLDQVLVGNAEFERAPSTMTHALLDVIETPRELKHVFKRVWHAWDPVDVKHPRAGALCGEIDLDDFIVFIALRCRSTVISLTFNRVTLTGHWSDLLSSLKSMHILAKEMYSPQAIEKPDGSPIAERLASFAALATRRYGKDDTAAMHQSDAGLRVIHQRKLEAQSDHTYQAIFGSVEVYRQRAIAERAESTPSDREWKARCRFIIREFWNNKGRAEAYEAWLQMRSATDADCARFVDLAALCGMKAVEMILEAATAETVVSSAHTDPNEWEWGTQARRLDAVVCESAKETRGFGVKESVRQAALFEIVRRVMASGGLSVALLLLNGAEWSESDTVLGSRLTTEQHQQLAQAFADAFGHPEGVQLLVDHLRNKPANFLANLMLWPGGPAKPIPTDPHPWQPAGAVLLAAARLELPTVRLKILRLAAPSSEFNRDLFMSLFAVDRASALRLIADIDPATASQELGEQYGERAIAAAKDLLRQFDSFESGEG